MKKAMKKIITIISVIAISTLCNNASAMLLVLCTKRPEIQRVYSSATATQRQDRYMLNQHRATFSVPQLSEETYKDLQKRLDRNNLAIQYFGKASTAPLIEQNKYITDHTFYGKKLNLPVLNELEKLIQENLSRS